MKTILFAPETFNLAETSRCLEVAKELRVTYRCLFSGYSDKYAHLIEEAGFEFRHLPPKMSEQECQNMLDFDQLKRLKRPLSHEQITRRIEEEVALIKGQQVALVVIGSTLTTFISARYCRVPLVYIKPYALSLPQCQQTLRAKDGSFIEKLGAWLWLKSPFIPFRLNQIAASYGLPVFKRTAELVEADLNLVTTLPTLGGFTALPANYAYVGPLYFRQGGPIPAAVLSAVEDCRASCRPLLYFAMGSSSNKALVLKLLSCFKQLALSVIAPVKSYLTQGEIETFQGSPILITDWLPADSVSQLVDGSVIHGGEGTVQTACASGKPFLAIGLQPEQRASISGCVIYGNALALPKGQITPKGIQALLKRLAEPAFLEKAQAMKALMAQSDGAAKAGDLIRQQLN